MNNGTKIISSKIVLIELRKFLKMEGVRLFLSKQFTDKIKQMFETYLGTKK
jgi:hypothetical protein